MLGHLARTTPWRHNCGIELTYITAKVDPKMDANTSHPKWGAYATVMDGYLTIRGLDKLTYCGAHSDPGCVEVPTKVIKSWQEAHDVCREITEMAKFIGLVPTHPEQQGGMGHVHIDITMDGRKLLTQDMMTRPYMPWVWVNPDAVQYCRSYKGDSLWYWDQWGDTYKLSGTYKFRVVNFVGDKRVEWRAFEAAENWREQEAQLAFLQRYFQWIVKGKGHKLNLAAETHASTDKDKAPNVYHEKFVNNFDACVMDFRDLIEDLELPWSRYSYLIEKHLVPSFMEPTARRRG